jgi:CRISPR/Cas system endoribonuclease Cas6 (RAMP superfamily)
MRLILHLQPDSRNACVPVHYNEFIQAMIYAHLDAHLAQALHDEGIPQGKRHLKLFTFSRLLGPCRVKGGGWSRGAPSGSSSRPPWCPFWSPSPSTSSPTRTCA